jgi:MFS family permease
MDSWSLNPYDLFIPNLMHPLYGAAVNHWFPVQLGQWVERGVTLGFVAVVLGLVGTIAGRRRDVVLALATTWLAASLVALGPTLHWRDAQVRVHLGAHVAALALRHLSGTGGDTAAVRASVARDGVPIPLPALLMYKFVPLTSSMRVMARFALWSGFMTAALAGLGVLALCGRFGWSLRPVALTVVVLVAFESLTVIPVMTLERRPVDHWLASQPRSTVIVELPVDQAERALQDYWMTENLKPNLFGWVADSFDPPLQLERERVLKDFPAPTAIDYLRQSPATLLLVTPSQIPSWPAMQPVLDSTAGLTFLQQIGEVRVYRINR